MPKFFYSSINTMSYIAREVVFKMYEIATVHPFIFGIVSIPVSLILLTRLYCRMTVGRCSCATDMTGKTAIVTGGSSGLGKATVLALAKRGATVIFTCRDEERGRQVLLEAEKGGNRKNVILKTLDLNSFRSVRRFAQEIIENENRLDVLICNAGTAGSVNRTTTEDGCEEIMQSNYFGHFLLTNLLLDLLKKSSPSRIVNMSSMIYKRAIMNLDDLQNENTYKCRMAYYRSKMAMVLFTVELSRRLTTSSGVTANCLNPGLIDTRINRQLSGFGFAVAKFLFVCFGKTPEEGVQTILHLAMDPDLQNTSGKYFSDCKEKPIIPYALNKELCEQFWNASEVIVGLKK